MVTEKPTPPPTPLTVANSARHTARHTRAEWLTAIYHNMISFEVLFDEATTAGNHPLRKIRLATLLEAHPDWGKVRARTTLTSLVTYIGRPQLDILQLNVGWLVDPRTRGKRRTAFADVTRQYQLRRRPPWDGFPWHPPPDDPALTAHQYKLVHARSRTR